MEPIFYEGDHVLTFNWTEPKFGDVVVFKKNETLYLKRISGFNKNSLLVSGDSKASSNIGKVAKDEIIGKVIWKY